MNRGIAFVDKPDVREEKLRDELRSKGAGVDGCTRVVGTKPIELSPA